MELQRLTGNHAKSNVEATDIVKLLDVVNSTIEGTFTLVDELDLVASRKRNRFCERRRGSIAAPDGLIVAITRINITENN